MGCIIGPVHHKIKCLQDLDVDKFVKLSQVFLINLKPNEDVDYADDPFLPMSPMNALRSGNYSQDVKVTNATKKLLYIQLFGQIRNAIITLCSRYSLVVTKTMD